MYVTACEKEMFNVAMCFVIQFWICYFYIGMIIGLRYFSDRSINSDLFKRLYEQRNNYMCINGGI